MADPFDDFAFIVEEGALSPFEEQKLFHLSSFINNPNSDEEEEEENDHIPSPFPPADVPILICSLPETSIDANEENNNNKRNSPPSSSATKETSEVSAKKKKNRKKKFAKRRRLKGAQLKFSDSDSIHPESDPIPTVTIAPPPGTRKLPETLVTAKPVPALEKAMMMILDWREPDVTNGDRDILEIAAMKGVHFDRPTWWCPDGYSEDDMPNIW